MVDKIIFPKDVVVGKFYSVPHVLAYEFYGHTNIPIPINTPLHEDKDYINFNVLHFHIDWRFLNTKIYTDCCIDMHEPSYEIKSQVKDVLIIESAALGKLADTKVFYKNVKCKRSYNNNIFHIEFPIMYHCNWPTKLQIVFCGDHLRINENGQYVCPHKGAIVDLNHKDENGHAVCPAHLLRFNTQTLKAITL